MLSDLLLTLLVLEVAGVLWCLRPRPPAVVQEVAGVPPPPLSAISAPPQIPDPGLSCHCGHTHPDPRVDKYGLSHCPVCAAQRPHRFD